MFDAPAPLPLPTNEPVRTYAPGSPERAELKSALGRLRGEQPELPHVIGGRDDATGALADVREPHRHASVIGRHRQADAGVVTRAVDAALAAQRGWESAPFEARARVLLRAADLLAGPWRATINAATMLGQSKTAYQAEIDAACELADFLRFNVSYASRLLEQPLSPPGVRNLVELRPLEGFVLAVTPFNFTAIAGNLPTAPALLGNVVVWKPSESQALAAHHTLCLFQAAGLPDGVINLVHGSGKLVSDVCFARRELAGVHFTGSSEVFRGMIRAVGENVDRYRAYPRLVGETGGKDFVVAHPSAEAEALAIALVRGAFEYQGQKCSAASRAYVPRSLWPGVRDRMIAELEGVLVGDPTDFRTFMGAVIHERSWTKLAGWKERLEHDADATVLSARGWSRDEGWFAGPTVVEVGSPDHPLLAEELFGPVLGVHVYDDAKPGAFEALLDVVDRTSPYALTGAIFARERSALATAAARLRHAAGNLYLNDKPTGAVVGQQPFGGGRASGTNDKAGSALNLLRWCSPRTVKETFVPPLEVAYPSMSEA